MRRHGLAFAAAALLVAAGLQLWLCTQYVTIAPGWARPASTLVRVGEERGGGNLLYVVVVARRANLVDVVRSWMDPSIEVRPIAGQSARRLDWAGYARWMQEMMEESKAIAAAVAFRSLDYRIDLDALATGDIGPVPVDFQDLGIVGASAGLMIALEVFSQLTGENLAAQPVAGTGVLEADGTVYPVDGIRQKIATSLAAGAKVFLLPRGNLEEALGMARKIRLIPVETFEEAVAALRRLSAEE